MFMFLRVDGSNSNNNDVERIRGVCGPTKQQQRKQIQGRDACRQRTVHHIRHLQCVEKELIQISHMACGWPYGRPAV